MSTTEPLAQHPCQRKCSWVSTGTERDGLPLFHCESCASEWVRTEPWAPANVDGTVPPEVAEQVALRSAT